MQKQTPKPNDLETAKSLADEIMVSTLLRARDGKLRRGEAHSASELMQAFKNWSDGSQRCELVERAGDIKRLAGEVIEQGNRLTAELAARTKEIIRDAVAQGVEAASAANAERAVPNRKRARARTRSK